MTEHESTGAPDDAIFTALYNGAEQTRLPGEPAFDVELGLRRFSAWLDNDTRTPAAARSHRTLRKARRHRDVLAPAPRPGTPLRKMAVYLGLVEDEDEYDYAYEEYDAYDEDEQDGRTPGEWQESPAQPARVTTLHPRTFNDARTIGEHFREGIPVIMDLTEMADGDARRLVDFAAGLIFGLRGSIEKVTNRVFLLSPASIESRPEPQSTASSADGGAQVSGEVANPDRGEVTRLPRRRRP